MRLESPRSHLQELFRASSRPLAESDSGAGNTRTGKRQWLASARPKRKSRAHSFGRRRSLSTKCKHNSEEDLLEFFRENAKPSEGYTSTWVFEGRVRHLSETSKPTNFSTTQGSKGILDPQGGVGIASHGKCRRLYVDYHFAELPSVEIRDVETPTYDAYMNAVCDIAVNSMVMPRTRQRECVSLRPRYASIQEKAEQESSTSISRVNLRHRGSLLSTRSRTQSGLPSKGEVGKRHARFQELPTSSPRNPRHSLVQDFSSPTQMCSKVNMNNLRTPNGIDTINIETTPITSQPWPSNAPTSDEDVRRKLNDSTPGPKCKKPPDSSSNLACTRKDWSKRKPIKYAKDCKEGVQVTSEIVSTGSRDAEDATQCEAEQSFVAKISLGSTGQSPSEDEAVLGAENLCGNSRAKKVHFHSNNVRIRHSECSKIAFPRMLRQRSHEKSLP